MPERKKMSKGKMAVLTGLTVGMYIVYVMLLFWYHPFVVSAAEEEETENTENTGTIPGGVGNTVIANSVVKGTKSDFVMVTQTYLESADNWEIIGRMDSPMGQIIFQSYNPSTGISEILSENNLKDCTGYFTNTMNGNIIQSYNYDFNRVGDSITYCDIVGDRIVTFSVSGCKIFKDEASMKAYIQSGSLDGIIREPVLDKDWFLKNVQCIVTADDSPSSEAGEDATYITFTWDTDNLQEGDLLEIKTHSYYKTLTGEEHGGFYDYITQWNNISAYVGKYGPFSQHEATKAWYKSLDYHPLIFKSYDTDIYFLRPIRNGKVGGWVKVFMTRNSLTNGSPYIEKVEYGDLDKEGNWTVNKDLTDKEGGYGVDQNGNKFYPDTDNPFEGTNLSGIFKSFFDFFKDIPSMLGGLPGLVNSTIGFLPNWVIGFIAIGIVVVIILRIVGR